MKRLVSRFSAGSVLELSSFYSAATLLVLSASACQFDVSSKQGSESSSSEGRARLSLSTLEGIDKEKSNELSADDDDSDEDEEDGTKNVPCKGKAKLNKKKVRVARILTALFNCNEELEKEVKDGHVLGDVTLADVRSRAKGPGDFLIQSRIKNLSIPEEVSRIRFEDLFYEIPDPRIELSKEQFRVPLVVNVDEQLIHVVLDQAAYNPKVVFESGGGFSVIYDQVMEVQKGGTIKVVNSPRIERFNNEGIRQSSVDVKAVMGLDASQVVKFDAFSEVNSETLGALGGASVAAQTGSLLGSVVIDGVSSSVKVGTTSLSTVSSETVSPAQMNTFQSQAAARGFRAR